MTRTTPTLFMGLGGGVIYTDEAGLKELQKEIKKVLDKQPQV